MDIQAYIQSGIIESYVLGIATDQERSELEQLMNEHPELRMAIDDFSVSMEQYSLAHAVAPPVNIKSNIINVLAGEFRSSPVAVASMNVVVNNAKEKEKLTPPPKYKVWRFAAAASIILLVVSSAFNFYLFKRYSDTSSQYQALLQERNVLVADNSTYQVRLRDWETAGQLMADTNVIIVKMPGVAGKESMMATVLWNKSAKTFHVMPNKLPAPPSGKQYQLWAMVNGKPVDAGMVSFDCFGACKTNKYIPGAEAFAITLEKQGGSPIPTMAQLFVMGKV